MMMLLLLMLICTDFTDGAVVILVVVNVVVRIGLNVKPNIGGSLRLPSTTSPLKHLWVPCNVLYALQSLLKRLGFHYVTW